MFNDYLNKLKLVTHAIKSSDTGLKRIECGCDV